MHDEEETFLLLGLALGQRDCAQCEEDSDITEDYANRRRWCPLLQQKSGTFWALLAALGISAKVIILGELVTTLDPVVAIFIRSLALIVGVACLVWEDSNRYNWFHLITNLLVGLFDVFAMTAVTCAMVYISVADVCAINYNQTIPSSVAAWLILAEPLDTIDGALAILNGIGLVLICETIMNNIPENSSFETSLLGVVIAFFGLISNVFVLILVRSLAYRNNEDPFLLTFLSGCIGVIFSAIYLSATNSWDYPKTDKEIFLCFLLIITTFTYYAYMAALQKKDVRIVSLTITMIISINFCYSFLIKQQTLFLSTVIGVFLTIGSTVALPLKSYILD